MLPEQKETTPPLPRLLQNKLTGSVIVHYTT
jgi:hypothetical protein